MTQLLRRIHTEATRRVGTVFTDSGPELGKHTISAKYIADAAHAAASRIVTTKGRNWHLDHSDFKSWNHRPSWLDAFLTADANSFRDDVTVDLLLEPTWARVMHLPFVSGPHRLHLTRFGEIVAYRLWSEAENAPSPVRVHDFRGNSKNRRSRLTVSVPKLLSVRSVDQDVTIVEEVPPEGTQSPPSGIVTATDADSAGQPQTSFTVGYVFKGSEPATVPDYVSNELIRWAQ